MYIIVNQKDMMLSWSNQFGWTNGIPDVFTEEETKYLVLPDGGAWHELEERDEVS